MNGKFVHNKKTFPMKFVSFISDFFSLTSSNFCREVNIFETYSIGALILSSCAILFKSIFTLFFAFNLRSNR